MTMRVALAALAVACAACAWNCLADAVGRAGISDEPMLYFHASAGDPAFGSVDLQNLSAGMVAQLRRADPSTAQWQSSFAVFVDQAGSPASALSPSENLPPILGQYQILPNGVRFTPRFPPLQGLKYHATADLSAVLGSLGPANRLSLAFSLPPAAVTASTVVDKVFPSGDVLPENLLRFYVFFSAPMQRGQARDQIVLLGPDGQPVSAAFFNAPTELWDPAMERLTVLLDPGRIKRGVGPNVELGPPLRQGDRYTLVIGTHMIDATGNRLRGTFAKSFRVAAANRKAIDPRQWIVTPPAGGTRQALALTFPAPLDQALLSRDIRIVGAGQKPVAGDIEIDQHETRWAFTPSAPWQAGLYHVEVGASLEDVSGNTIWAPFDVDERNSAASQSAQRQVRLPLTICPDKKTDLQRESNDKRWWQKNALLTGQLMGGRACLSTVARL
jgi:hypothetical protein